MTEIDLAAAIDRHGGQRSPIRTPVATSEITAEWLTEALATKLPGVVVTRCHITDEVHGMAIKARVRLEYNDAGRRAGLPPSLIVKAGFGRFPPEYEVYSYHIEVYAYQRVVPAVEVNAPRCFYAGIDGAGRGVIVMEDLDLRGVRFCRVTEPLDYRQAAAFLDAYARIHAAHWGSPEFAPGGRLGWLDATMDDGIGIRFWIDHCLEPDNWARVSALPRAMAVPRECRDRDRMAAALARLGEIWREGPFCLNHGDEHLGNLFIEPDGRPGMVDWQTKRSTWSQSFAYFLAGALDPADRRRWDRALLAHYLGRLGAYGAPAPEFDAAWTAYRQSIVFGLFIWMCNDVSMQPEVNNVANSARFAMAALDNDSFGALGL